MAIKWNIFVSRSSIFFKIYKSKHYLEHCWCYFYCYCCCWFFNIEHIKGVEMLKRRKYNLLSPTPKYVYTCKFNKTCDQMLLLLLCCCSSSLFTYSYARWVTEEYYNSIWTGVKCRYKGIYIMYTSKRNYSLTYEYVQMSSDMRMFWLFVVYCCKCKYLYSHEGGRSNASQYCITIYITIGKQQ